MASDDEINVKVTADTSDIKSGMSDASDSVNGLQKVADSAFEGVGESLKGLLQPLHSLVDGLGGLHAAFEDITGYEILKTALSDIQEPLEKIQQLSETAIKENVNAAVFGQELGVTANQAQALSAALSGVGSSSSEYAQMALKLDRQVKSNEDSLNALGLVTRDQNGNLLDQITLMNNAFTTLQEYKAGTDQNSVAMQLFGRSAQDVYTIMRATPEVVDAVTEEIQSQNAAVTQWSEDGAKKAEDASILLTGAFHNFAVGIGNDLNPTLADLENTLTSALIPSLNVIRDILDVLIATVDTIATGFKLLFTVIKDGAEEATVSTLALARVTTDLATGNFTDAKSTINANLDGITDSVKAHAAEIAQIGQQYNQRISGLFGTNDSAKTPVQPQSGTKSAPTDANDEGDNTAKAPKRDNSDEQFQRMLDQEAKAGEKFDDDQIKSKERVALETLKTAQEEANGEIGIQENLAAQEYAIRAKASEDELAAASRAGDNAGMSKALDDMKLEYQKYLQDIDKLEKQAAQQKQEAWEKTVAPVKRALDQTVDGVLQGTQSMSQAMAKLGQNITLSIINQGLDKIIDTLPDVLTKWLFNEDAMTAATQAENAIRSALGLAADETSQIATLTAAQAAIQAYAAEAAAAAFASTAAIPMVGPELAPAAAASAYGEVMSFSVASAAGGWVVPSDQLAMVHENEMILPARYTSMFNNMASNGAGSTSSGDTHIHFNVNAMDQNSVSQFFANNGKHIANAVSQQVRNGNQVLRRAAGG
jgi:hypothetical protein